MKKMMSLFFICFGLGLSCPVKGIDVEELALKADEAARSAYERINQNWEYPENATTPVTGTASWEVISVMTNAGPTSLVVWNSEKTPHLEDALEEILNAKDLIMDCSNAARLVRLYMICRMLGKEKARALAAHYLKQYSNSLFNFMNALSWSFVEKTESLEEKGIYCFPFVNIEKYPYFKPDGYTRNHNVVRLLDKTYFGFAPGSFDAPKEEEAVEKLLLDSLCDQEGVALERKEEHQNYCGVLQKNSKLFKTMRQSYQQKQGYFRLSMEKVKSYIEEAS